MKKIAIIGTGAMGSIYAALFKEAGHSVVAIDIWEEHINKINSKEYTSWLNTLPVVSDPYRIHLSQKDN